jgi:hypothetical protein
LLLVLVGAVCRVPGWRLVSQGAVRADALAKSGPREVPVAAGVLRLYADYLFDEYGALDSDYVFVNLWAGLEGSTERLPIRLGHHWLGWR